MKPRLQHQALLGIALAALLFIGGSQRAEAAPEPGIVIDAAASHIYLDPILGCTAYFVFTPSSGTGSKNVTVELEFDEGAGWVPAFSEKYVNDVAAAQGKLVSTGTLVGFRARIVRNNGTALTDWVSATQQCGAA